MPNLNRIYPYYGKSKKTGRIVLFTAPQVGDVVDGDALFNGNTHATDWIEQRFDPTIWLDSTGQTIKQIMDNHDE